MQGKILLEDCPEDYRAHLKRYGDLSEELGLGDPRYTEYETRLGNEDEGGTPDQAGVALPVHEGVGVIVDIKYGMGVTVKAEGNLQLMDYAYFFDKKMSEEGIDLKRFKLVIYQPRSYEADEDHDIHEVSIEEVRAHRETRLEITKRVEELEIFGETVDDFTEGDHCQFCPRQLSCPLKQEATLPALTQAGVAKREDEFALSMDQVYQIVAAKSKINKIIRDAEALVRSKLEAGEIRPEDCGFKLVSKLGNRKWSDEARNKLVRKYKKANVVEETLISPNKLETWLKKEGKLDAKTKKYLEGLTHRSSSLSLVSNDAKGEHAITLVDDFEVFEDK